MHQRIVCMRGVKEAGAFQDTLLGKFWLGEKRENASIYIFITRLSSDDLV